MTNSLVIDVQTVEGQQNKVLLNVEVPAEQTTQEYNKACRRVGQRINVPGFRRGKAPVRLIEKSVGVDRIKEEALERFLPYLFAEVVSQKELDVVSPPRITDLSFELGEAMKVVAELDLRPEVTLPAFPLAVDVVKSEEAPDAKAEEIQRRLKGLARPAAVEGRTVVEATDIVTLNFEGKLNGELIPGGAADDFVLDLNNNHFIEGFTQQLPGKTVDEAFTMDVVFPSDYFDESLAGQTTVFTATVTKLEQHKTPELNEESVKDLGNYETVAAFEADIDAQLQERHASMVKMRKEHAVVQALLKSVDVTIHDSMVDQEVRVMAEEFMARLRQQGMSPEAFVNQIGRDNLLANFRLEAIERLKTSLSFAAIAKAQSFNVDDDAFSAEVKTMAEANNVDEKVVMRNLSRNPKAIQALTDHLLGLQVIEWLLGNATFTEVDAPAPVEQPVSALHASDAEPVVESATEEPVAEEATAE